MKLAVELTDEQVCKIVRSASAEKQRAGLLSKLGELSDLRERLASWREDPTCSQATLRAVLVYAAFPVDGSERGVVDVAGELGISPSTTHRYARSWVAVGLLVQDPSSRLYRRTAGTTEGRSDGS
ncbi:MAG TPA: helix-turn-helix domain-containing protein [Solirubrobacteraceae bacterium]|nr:helix-turn-helix domain-containing protein [Solirubrobacteraceae bacterium]